MTDALAAATKEDAALLVRVQTLLDRWTLKRYRLMQKYPDTREFMILSSGFTQDIILIPIKNVNLCVGPHCDSTPSSKHARKPARTPNVSAMDI